MGAIRVDNIADRRDIVAFLAATRKENNCSGALGASVGSADSATADTGSLEEVRNAAEQGDPTAQFRMGELYGHGEGVKQDYVVAADWFLKSANQENEWAQAALGDMYVKGLGVAVDYA